ncbi:hypothetical protein ZWY2020_052557 [Hordeum vulgare]|nr:hypothetical protein ZWY2020_052557 [Hordeum vulgare]
MTASSSSSLWILAPTHHTAAGARPLRLPFHSVSVTSLPVSPPPPAMTPVQATTTVPTGAPACPCPCPCPATSPSNYLGCPGAYSEAAAKKAYPSCETVPCEYFETTFQMERPELEISLFVTWRDLSSLEQIKIVIVNLQTTENGW